MGEDQRWAMCPTLGVRDVRAAAEYFRDRFGFEVGSIFTAASEDVYAIVKRGGAEIHLQIRRLPLATERESIEGDVYVRVPDVDAVHGELVARGATILRGLLDEAYGQRDFNVQGPEHLRLTFGSELSPDRD